jgi:hypothetical protein
MSGVLMLPAELWVARRDDTASADSLDQLRAGDNVVSLQAALSGTR